jgi:hypothetical protein
MKKINFLTIIIFFLLCLSYLFPNPYSLIPIPYTLAVPMKSGSYKLRVGNSQPSNSQQSAGKISSQEASGSASMAAFPETGFYSRAGLPYLTTVLPFSFNITELTIDFGKLESGAPITANHILNIDTGGANNYKVLAFANHPLRIINATTIIPDTTCDNPQALCDETIAQPWTDNSIYGFGFNISGDDIPADFVNQTYFRPFANESNDQKPQAILEGVNIYRSRQAIINYRVNVPQLQAMGIYDNVVNLIAVPGY